MPDDPYSLADLARLADVTPRTIRYYVTQGLLPSPAAAGPATRYTEGHLLRLRLIGRLQREHLPLATIRARLERLGDADIAAALEVSDGTEPAPEIGAGATVAFVRELMAKASVAPRFHDTPTAAASAATAGPMAQARVLRAMELPVPPAPAAALPSPSLTPPAMLAASAPAEAMATPSEPAEAMPAPPPSTAGDRSTWERVSLSPDVELHVRRPLDRMTNKRVEKLLELAIDLFRDRP